jgi:hypothetical protein
MSLIWCACGNLVRYAGDARCEECFVAEQQRLGISRRGTSKHLHNINTMVQSNREGCDVPFSSENRNARRGRV